MKKILFEFILFSLITGSCAASGLKQLTSSKVNTANVPLTSSFTRTPSFSSKSSVIRRFAIGSCNKEGESQAFWNTVLADKPSLFVFMGDNVYADAIIPSQIKNSYLTLGNNSYYRNFSSKVPVIATWDDHDYGFNDIGRGYILKNASQKIFLDFFREPENSPRRTTPGIYTSYIGGPIGKRVQIILLDTRFFRSDLVLLPREERVWGKYKPNPDKNAVFLGEEQWKWLEYQLSIPANLRFIVSSVQVLSQSHGHEAWDKFPFERARLFNLINKTRARGVIFLSGDRHFARFYKSISPITGIKMYEFTSSLINRTQRPHDKEDNDPFAASGKPVFLANYGLVDINWENRFVILRIRHSFKRGTIKELKIPFSEIGI